MTTQSRPRHTRSWAGPRRAILALFAAVPLACQATESESTSRGQSEPVVSDAGVDGTGAESGGGNAEVDDAAHESATSEQAVLSAPSLGAAASFGVLAGSTVISTGTTTILEGDLGVAPGLAITGFPPGEMQGGTMYAGGANAPQAQNDVAAAYVLLAGDACTQDLTDRDLGGLTLTQGVYCFTSEAHLTGTLTLDAQGDPNAVFVFQVGSDLTTASNASVVLTNGGQFCRAFWQIGGSASLGAYTAFAGSILATTNITLETGASVSGRALARNGAVTMDTNQIYDIRVAHDGSCVGPGSDVGVAGGGP
jgi:Ice-binding-like